MIETILLIPVICLYPLLFGMIMYFVLYPSFALEIINSWLQRWRKFLFAEKAPSQPTNKIFHVPVSSPTPTKNDSRDSGFSSSDILRVRNGWENKFSI